MWRWIAVFVLSLSIAVGCSTTSGAETHDESGPANRDTSSKETNGDEETTETPDESGAKTDSKRPFVIEPTTVATFGKDLTGFVRWTSRQGRLVVVYRFIDANNDGEISFRFSQHGSTGPDHPVPAVYDTKTGEFTRYDSFLTAGPDGRYVVLKKADSIWLIDASSGDRRDLTKIGVPSSGDGNRCLPPQQVSIGPGSRLFFPDTQNDVGHVRWLDGDQSQTIASPPKELWRFQSMGAGWGLLMNVPADTNGNGRIDMPRQHTSCACRWCKQFALSYGFYGWDGDTFERYVVPPGTNKKISIQGRIRPLSPNLLRNQKGELKDTEGKRLQLPEGCDRALDVTIHTYPTDASARAVLKCGDKFALWSPGTGEKTMLPVGVTPYPSQTATAHPKLERRFIVAKDARKEPTLARISTIDGSLYPTSVPASDKLSTWDRWVIATDQKTLHLLDKATGGHRSKKLEKPIASVEGPVVTTDPVKRPEVKNTSGTRYIVTSSPHPQIYKLERKPVDISSGGCAVTATSLGERDVERGPWRLFCGG